MTDKQWMKEANKHLDDMDYDTTGICSSCNREREYLFDIDPRFTTREPDEFFCSHCIEQMIKGKLP